MCSLSQPLHLLVIDIAGVAAHAIMDGVEPFAGKVGRRAVGKVAAHVYAHAEDGVAGLQYGKENALIGLAAGMRLHIGELAVEQLLRALDGEFFRDVDHLAAAVIALAGVAFRIFVGEDGPCGFEHGLRHVVLGRDQLDLVMLTEKLTIQNAAISGSDWLSGAVKNLAGAVCVSCDVCCFSDTGDTGLYLLRRIDGAV